MAHPVQLLELLGLVGAVISAQKLNICYLHFAETAPGALGGAAVPSEGVQGISPGITTSAAHLSQLEHFIRHFAARSSQEAAVILVSIRKRIATS